MAENPNAASADWKRHLYLLLAINTSSHVQNTGGRFAVLLFALHQGASPLVAGILFGLNSLVPALTSVAIGRMLDRRRDMRMPLLIASVFTTAGSLLPVFWESITALFIFTAVTGAAFNVCRIGSQQMTGRYGTADDRAGSYNLYAQGLAAGSLLAPLICGFAIDHGGYRIAFLALAAMSLPMVIVLGFNKLYLPASDAASSDKARGKEQSKLGAGVLSLLKLPELRRVLIAGVCLMTVWDMFVFAWPLYGTQLKLSASQIGLIAGIFYAGTFIVRTFATLLLRRFSPWQLLLMAMLLSSLMFLAYGFLTNLIALGALSLVLGMVLGIMQPMTMSLIYEEAPPERRGEAIGLRLTMAFVLHNAAPLLAGALASVLGMGSVWVVAAATLMAGGLATRRQWHYRPGARQ